MLLPVGAYLFEFGGRFGWHVLKPYTGPVGLDNHMNNVRPSPGG
jgi:hypothetical protein